MSNPPTAALTAKPSSYAAKRERALAGIETANLAPLSASGLTSHRIPRKTPRKGKSDALTSIPLLR